MLAPTQRHSVDGCSGHELLGAQMDISADDDVADLTVSTASSERRRYNRRRPESTPVPPYFSVFERIADALEEMVGLIAVAVSDPRRNGGDAPGGANQPEDAAYP